MKPTRGLLTGVLMGVAIVVTFVGVAHASAAAEASSASVSPWAIIAAAGSIATFITFILRLARREVRTEVAALRLEIVDLQRQLLDAFRRCPCALPAPMRPKTDDEEDEP